MNRFLDALHTYLTWCAVAGFFIGAIAGALAPVLIPALIVAAVW